MDCLAAVFRDVGAPMSIEHIRLDPPGPTEMLVRIAAVGLCRTDYHVMRGERRVAMRPMVLGHEAAGVVEEIGVKVGAIKRGDHVILTFIPASGICRWCRQVGECPLAGVKRTSQIEAAMSAFDPQATWAGHSTTCI